MIPELAVWLIFFAPLASFVLIGVIIRPFFNRYATVAGQLTLTAMAVSFGLSVWALFSASDAGGSIAFDSREWLTVGGLDISIGILMDPLTAIMLVVVSGVSLLVQFYSISYMKDDPGYARYFAFMSLFTASMLGLVLASNLVQLFVFWELVGLSSFLLIGFWYHRPAAAAAAKKAFIVTRLGDFGFLLGIMYLVYNGDAFTANGLNPLEIAHINQAATAGLLATSVLTWIALGFFAGAIGKSGQFPLHTWLPDAMEGPTPVSALIHAATMVAAGVFLVARFFPLFESSEAAMNTVAIVGGFTALFAATMGLAANDLKRVLAFSTVSQLGYMMFALGIGAYGAAVFHLFTHAFFKALLFLGAGSVAHATGNTFDMRYIGGLRKHMRWTYVTFLIGGLSLAGIFPLSGFWSKDEILAHGLAHFDGVTTVMLWLPMIAVAVTAIYIARAIAMTFEGEFRGGSDADPDVAEPHPVHLGESPWIMVSPLVLLAIAAAAIGFFANPIVDLGVIGKHWMPSFLQTDVAEFEVGLAAATSAVSILIFATVYWVYVRRPAWVQSTASALSPVHTLLLRKYYFDELYEDLITRDLFYGGLAKVLDWTDRNIVDGVVRFIDVLGRNSGRVFAQFQTGQVQGYGVAISIGVLAILGVYLLFK